MDIRTVGEALYVARRRAGLQQAHIADAMGVSRAFVSAIEKGEKAFPRHHLSSLPAEIQAALREILIAEHEAEIEKLRNGAAE